MSRTLLKEDEKADTETGSLAETQTLLWKEVMRVMGYPESWGEVIRARLAADGKVIQWIMADGAEKS